MSSSILIIGSTVIAIFMGTMMMLVRMKVAKQPMTIKKIVIPPIMMSTGMIMFIFPPFRISFLEVTEALLVGVICSILLIKTTKFERKDGAIYVIPSKAFIFILLGLFLIRLVMKQIVGSTISFGETSGLFYILAFGMIVSWRAAMLIKYHHLKNSIGQ